MTRASKKQRELRHLSHFRDLYHNFPPGEIQSGDEPPDFVIECEDRRIGLEVTNLFPNHTAEEKGAVKRDALLNKIVRKAQNEFEARYKIRPMVSFTFDRWIRFHQNEMRKFVEWIIVDVYKCFKSIHSEGHYCHCHSGFETPHLLSLLVTKSLDHPGPWMAGDAAQLRDLSEVELQKSILKKEKLLSPIKDQYSELWLLIVEPFEFVPFDSLPQIVYPSAVFGKIFFIRTLTEAIMEIK